MACIFSPLHPSSAINESVLHMSRKTKNVRGAAMPHSSPCQLVPLGEGSRDNGGVPQGGELSTLTASLLGRTLTAEWQDQDASPESPSLFIKSTKYTTKEDKLGQTKSFRNIIHGYQGQNTNPKRQRLGNHPWKGSERNYFRFCRSHGALAFLLFCDKAF